MKEYKSKNKFNLIDYSIGHQRLLLRSNEKDGNTDIIFYGVSLININITLDTINIIELTNYSEHKLSTDILKVLGYRENKLYSITSSSGNFYIVAGYFKVTKNRLGIMETSLNLEKNF